MKVFRFCLLLVGILTCLVSVGCDDSGENNFFSDCSSLSADASSDAECNGGSSGSSSSETSGRGDVYAGSGTKGNSNGKGTAAQFSLPSGIVFDESDNLYVADLGNLQIRKIDTETEVTTFSGGNNKNSLDELGVPASFEGPDLLTLNKNTGMLYLYDQVSQVVRQISQEGKVTTFTDTKNKFHNPQGMTVDAQGVLYIADTENHQIVALKSTDIGIEISTLVGNGSPGYTDGSAEQGSTVQFNRPWSIIYSSQEDALFVTDFGNLCIRKITLVSKSVETIAGGVYGNSDGPGLSASFSNPKAITVDSAGNLYLIDSLNDVLRKIAALDRTVTTLSQLNKEVIVTGANSLAVDSSDHVYLADTLHHRILKAVTQ
ncbi:hypothetical protein WDW89_19320 [Deltaproteobacteria bacterium TL4]